MKTENRIAFKEWAVVTEALRAGKQILILRKGGIREERGDFQVEHDEFFLFPTYEHQNPGDLKPEFHSDLKRLVETELSPDQLPIRCYAETLGVIRLSREEDLDRLDSHHVWSSEAVRKRFHFGREKGLSAIAVKIYELPAPHLIRLTLEYGGCKSWVELGSALSTKGARPVLDEKTFQEKWKFLQNTFSFINVR